MSFFHSRVTNNDDGGGGVVAIYVEILAYFY